MTITAVIAEYNPFHNGHAYQLAKARELTGADYLVVIMSGDFVQRGAPAILDQHDRAELALLGGADLVLQLPCHFALGSAQHFARGAVSLLTALGCVDFLCFGSEYGDTAPFLELADVRPVGAFFHVFRACHAYTHPSHPHPPPNVSVSPESDI